MEAMMDVSHTFPRVWRLGSFPDVSNMRNDFRQLLEILGVDSDKTINVLMVMSETGINAVEYGGCGEAITELRGNLLHVTIVDHHTSPTEFVPEEISPRWARGHGNLIVQAASQEKGLLIETSLGSDGGKIVEFDIPLNVAA